jgi:NAD-specific glutamate dehydrogenase
VCRCAIGDRSRVCARSYVQDVQAIIVSNAALEFECIWRANEQGLGHRSLLTDVLSDKINNTNDFINRSTLYDDKVRACSDARVMRLTRVCRC